MLALYLELSNTSEQHMFHNSNGQLIYSIKRPKWLAWLNFFLNLGSHVTIRLMKQKCLSVWNREAARHANEILEFA